MHRPPSNPRIPLYHGMWLLVFTWLLAGCATNPVSGESDFVLMSEQQEIALGQRYNSEILKDMPAYEDAKLTAMVQSIGEELAAHSHRSGLDYHFTIVDSPTVNAFALPGGYIYVTRGILTHFNSEAELAAVLGHEIGHVTGRHGAERLSAATLAMAGVLIGALASDSCACCVVSSSSATTWPSSTRMPSSTSTSRTLPVISEETVACRRATT